MYFLFTNKTRKHYKIFKALISITTFIVWHFVLDTIYSLLPWDLGKFICTINTEKDGWNWQISFTCINGNGTTYKIVSWKYRLCWFLLLIDIVKAVLKYVAFCHTYNVLINLEWNIISECLQVSILSNMDIGPF